MNLTDNTRVACPELKARPPVLGHDRGVAQPSRTRDPLHTTIVTLADRAAERSPEGLDGLRLERVAMAPEIRLHLAEDAIVLWARMEAEAGRELPAPFWASAWLGGQALARFLLDHRELVAGRRVLDVAAGSGVVGIAASLAGADSVTANDIDPYAAIAIELNARANDVDISVDHHDLLDGDGGDAEVVLAGDVFYSPSMAGAMLAFLERASARGARVLIGDPGRGDLPDERLRIIATFPTAEAASLVDAQIEHVHVLQLVPVS
jgi:predicted nicotinamide N-methyase